MNDWIFWVIVIVSLIALLVLACFLFFGLLLSRLRLWRDGWERELIHYWMNRRPPDYGTVQNIIEDYFNRRNEFWTLYGQFVLSLFVILCVTILLLTRVITADAGLPILSGIGGFAIGKNISAGRTRAVAERQAE